MNELNPKNRSFIHSSDHLMLLLMSLIYIVPLWAFRYLPTQDGPSHLANATILKDYDNPGTRYREFFEIRWRTYPNWTSLVLLAGLFHLLPPLIAEKVLASVYVLGFVYGYRYLLRSFDPNRVSLAHFALLFVYNRCFLMGFYNFCLSSALFWVVLGYCTRRKETFRLRESLELGLLLLVTYFTHLIGFALSIAGAGLVLAWGPGWRRRNVLVALAIAPTLFLGLYHLSSTGFFDPGGVPRKVLHAPPILSSSSVLAYVFDRFASINGQLSGAYDLGIPIGAVAVEIGMVVLLILPVFRATAAPARTPIILFSIAIVVLYLLIPDEMKPHGGPPFYADSRFCPRCYGLQALGAQSGALAAASWRRQCFASASRTWAYSCPLFGLRTGTSASMR